jgi:hypothetical protein
LEKNHACDEKKQGENAAFAMEPPWLGGSKATDCWKNRGNYGEDKGIMSIVIFKDYY